MTVDNPPRERAAVADRSAREVLRNADPVLSRGRQKSGRINQHHKRGPAHGFIGEMA